MSLALDTISRHSYQVASTTLWLSAFLTILAVAYLCLLIDRKRKNFQLLYNELGYATPKVSNPLYGHMDEFASRENEFKWHSSLGKIFGFYYCDDAHLRVSDLSLVNEIFLKRNKVFNARTWTEYRLQAVIKSILFNKGHDWKKSRQYIQPALAEYRVRSGEDSSQFHDIQVGLDKLIGHFKSLVRCEGAKGLEAEGASQPGDFNRLGYAAMESDQSATGWVLHLNAYKVIAAVTLDVIFRLAFNMDTVDVTLGADEPSLKKVRYMMSAPEMLRYKVALAVPLSRFFLVPWMMYFDPMILAYKKFLSSIVNRNLDELASQAHQKAPGQTAGPKRICNVLFNEYKAGNLRRSEVVANTMAVLVAGFETTATTSTYVLWCIGKHEHCKQRLRSDILSYGVGSKYLDMFIKEVMRMYPALPNFVIRTPHEDTKVSGYTIKRGMSVYMSVNSIHHDESIWPDPYRFDPERFAEGKTYPVGAYAPFGLGHRMCAGFQLALREIKSIVCGLLTNFDIQLIAPQEMITESTSIFLTRPIDDIRLKLVPALEPTAPAADATNPPAAAGAQECSARQTAATPATIMTNAGDAR